MDDTTDLHLRRFDATCRADFFYLHGPAHAADRCYCVAWWVPTWQGWGERTAEQNRTLREHLCDRGEYDGYLLHRGDQPVGWCQMGQRDRLSKLVQQFGLPPNPAAWAITCFFIVPAYRRRGLALRTLALVLADLRSRGIQRVEAFPKRGVDLDAGDLWNGPETIFRAAGFAVVRDDPQRPVLALDL
jgi:RimJ/RimL family protein N-acetyltransferase